jgi:hypothetical protein
VGDFDGKKQKSKISSCLLLAGCHVGRWFVMLPARLVNFMVCTVAGLFSGPNYLQ